MRAGGNCAVVRSFSWRFCLERTPLLRSAAVEDLKGDGVQRERRDWLRVLITESVGNLFCAGRGEERRKRGRVSCAARLVEGCQEGG
jgi:hypothetical protein